MEDIEIDSAAKLRLTVSQILPGTEVDVTLIRRGETLVLPVTLGSLNGDPVPMDDVTSPLEGVSLRELEAELRDGFSIPDEIDGVIVTQVADDSPFVEKLERLMVILEVNGEPVESVEDIEASLVEGEQNRLYIWAGGTKRFVILKL